MSAKMHQILSTHRTAFTVGQLINHRRISLWFCRLPNPIPAGTTRRQKSGSSV
jgi:hypothetical protein